MSEKLSEDQQKALYWSLLRGLAKECQDRLCAQDKQHDWSPVHQTRLEHDLPLRFDPREPMVCNDVARHKSERHCLNCGKSETW